MIQNTNDIYKLIQSPLYGVKYVPLENYSKGCISYNLFNKNAPHERIDIEIHTKFMEIFKYNNMNSEYYEYISRTNKRGQRIFNRFEKVLFPKRIVAMVDNIDQKYR